MYIKAMTQVVTQSLIHPSSYPVMSSITATTLFGSCKQICRRASCSHCISPRFYSLYKGSKLRIDSSTSTIIPYGQDLHPRVQQIWRKSENPAPSFKSEVLEHMDHPINEQLSLSSEPSKKVESISSDADSKVAPSSSLFTATSRNESESAAIANADGVSTTENYGKRDKPLNADKTAPIAYEEEADEDGDEVEYTNNAGPIFDLIQSRVTNILKSTTCTPPHPDTFSAFKAFWREKFAEMRSELAARNESSIFLTSPPLKVLEIEVKDAIMEHSCPCIFDYVGADIVIREEGGITRDHFLKAISDGLYGEDVEREGMPLIDRYGNGRLVVRKWNYMTVGDDCFYYHYDGMRIWMECEGVKGGDDGD